MIQVIILEWDITFTKITDMTIINAKIHESLKYKNINGREKNKLGMFLVLRIVNLFIKTINPCKKKKKKKNSPPKQKKKLNVFSF